MTAARKQYLIGVRARRKVWFLTEQFAEAPDENPERWFVERAEATLFPTRQAQAQATTLRAMGFAVSLHRVDTTPRYRAVYDARGKFYGLALNWGPTL